MQGRFGRRGLIGLIGAAAVARHARGADFDWKRHSGSSLHFMVSVHPWTEWAQKQLPTLEAETGIKITWEILYEDQLRQKLPLTLRSDPGSVDGFFTLPSWDAIAFSRAKWYAPLDKLIQSDATAPDWDFADFFPNIAKIHNVAGEQVGVPITIELQALFCNKAMLASKQIAAPATLDALLDAATKLKDPATDVAGVVTRGDGVQAVYTFAPFLFAFGGRWQDEKGTPELASAGAVKAFKYYGDLLRAGGPPNILGMQWKSTYPLFQQARAAMFIDATNFLTYFKDPSQSRVVDQVAVAPLPAGPAGAHSHGNFLGPRDCRLLEATGSDVDSNPVADIQKADDLVHRGNASAAVAPVTLQQRRLHARRAAGSDPRHSRGNSQRDPQRRQPARRAGPGSASRYRPGHRRSAARWRRRESRQRRTKTGATNPEWLIPGAGSNDSLSRRGATLVMPGEGPASMTSLDDTAQVVDAGPSPGMTTICRSTSLLPTLGITAMYTSPALRERSARSAGEGVAGRPSPGAARRPLP